MRASSRSRPSVRPHRLRKMGHTEVGRLVRGGLVIRVHHAVGVGVNIV